MPVVRRLLADTFTPVETFARLANEAPHAFLLESVVGGEHVARYSFVGASPAAVFRCKDGRFEFTRAGQAARAGVTGDPLGELGRRLAADAAPIQGLQHPVLRGLPRFTGGAVGCAAYDTVRYYERLASPPADDRGLADLEFGIYDEMVVFDHAHGSLLVLAHADLTQADVAAAYDRAVERIDSIVARLAAPGPGLRPELDLSAAPAAPAESTFRRGGFEDAVRRAQAYIVAGDVFQVVLSQRLRLAAAADPFDVYRALRVVNPSPFMFLVKSPACTLIGASPEILCRVEDRVITSRPLAGTRRRGAGPAEDAELERQLLADPKERAEHVMLVDLGRNDVGRVARPGSVKLADVMSVERYSHVMHLSSKVTGVLADGLTAVDALRTCLPVGTVTGAPKVRAMQIIDELEPVRRGPYGGAVGYLDFRGNMDTCIALRTIVATPAQSGTWTYDVQAGAGVVADSAASAEFEETLSKAGALLAAIGIAAGSAGTMGASGAAS